MGILPGGGTEGCYPLFGVQFSSNYYIFNANLHGPTMHPGLASIPSHRNAGMCTKGTTQHLWTAAEDRGQGHTPRI